MSVDPGARTLKKSVVYICWSENNFDEQKVKCKQKKIKNVSVVIRQFSNHDCQTPTKSLVKRLGVDFVLTP